MNTSRMATVYTVILSDGRRFDTDVLTEGPSGVLWFTAEGESFSKTQVKHLRVKKGVWKHA